MEIKVKNLFIRISPRKLRPAIFGVKGKKVNDAKVSLSFTNKKGSDIALKLLKSALAAAKENDLDEDKLFVKSIICNEGPRLKRSLLGSRGRMYKIKKRGSHLYITLGTVEDIATDKGEEKVDKKELMKEKNSKIRDLEKQ